MAQKLTEAQEAARRSWQYRAIEATRGNQTQLGAILLAVLGKAADNPPKFTGAATITSDGYVIAPFIARGETEVRQAFVCEVSELTENFSGLADHLKLDDIERIAMFAEVKKWIYKDYRADSTLHFTAKR